jgi:hypothetical protein
MLPLRLLSRDLTHAAKCRQYALVRFSSCSLPFGSLTVNYQRLQINSSNESIPRLSIAFLTIRNAVTRVRLEEGTQKPSHKKFIIVKRGKTVAQFAQFITAFAAGKLRSPHFALPSLANPWSWL